MLERIINGVFTLRSVVTYCFILDTHISRVVINWNVGMQVIHCTMCELEMYMHSDLSCQVVVKVSTQQAATSTTRGAIVLETVQKFYSMELVISWYSKLAVLVQLSYCTVTQVDAVSLHSLSIILMTVHQHTRYLSHVSYLQNHTC